MGGTGISGEDGSVHWTVAEVVEAVEWMTEVVVEYHFACFIANVDSVDGGRRVVSAIRSDV